MLKQKYPHIPEDFISCISFIVYDTIQNYWIYKPICRMHPVFKGKDNRSHSQDDANVEITKDFKIVITTVFHEIKENTFEKN